MIAQIDRCSGSGPASAGQPARGARERAQARAQLALDKRTATRNHALAAQQLIAQATST